MCKIIEYLKYILQPTCRNYPEYEMVPHDVLFVSTQPSGHVEISAMWKSIGNQIGHVEIPGKFHFKFPLLEDFQSC